MSGLPKGPWRAIREHIPDYGDVVVAFQDGGGNDLIASRGYDDKTHLDISPAVAVAVCALPELVAAAKGILDLHTQGEIGLRGREWVEVPRQFEALRDVLARIDSIPPPEE